MSAIEKLDTLGYFDLSDNAWIKLETAIGRKTSSDDRLEVLAQCWGWQGGQVLDKGINSADWAKIRYHATALLKHLEGKQAWLRGLDIEVGGDFLAELGEWAHRVEAMLDEDAMQRGHKHLEKIRKDELLRGLLYAWTKLTGRRPTANKPKPPATECSGDAFWFCKEILLEMDIDVGADATLVNDIKRLTSS